MSSPTGRRRFGFFLAALLSSAPAARAKEYFSIAIEPTEVAVGDPFTVNMTLPAVCRHVKIALPQSSKYKVLSSRWEDARPDAPRTFTRVAAIQSGAFSTALGAGEGQMIFSLRALAAGEAALGPVAASCARWSGESAGASVRVLGPAAAAMPASPREDDILGKTVAIQDWAAPVARPVAAPAPAEPASAAAPALVLAPAPIETPFASGHDLFVLEFGVGFASLLALAFFLRGAGARASTPPPLELRPGDVLAGKYEIVEKIGAGGMGLVLSARDRVLGRLVAVKAMRPEIRTSAKDREAFLAEAKIISQLSHPYIVGVHEIIQAGSATCLILDYVDGKPLSRLIEERGRLDWKTCRDIMRCVCEAIDFAHGRKILHRDLKPANIMVDKNGYAKVMDFGIARRAKDSIAKLTQAEATGTLVYMAPEQHMGRVSQASDIYALGLCLYEMLTGGVAFAGPDYLAQKEKRAYVPAARLLPSLPPQVDLLIAAALAPDPAKRIATAGELLSLLMDVKQPA